MLSPAHTVPGAHCPMHRQAVDMHAALQPALDVILHIVLWWSGSGPEQFANFWDLLVESSNFKWFRLQFHRCQFLYFWGGPRPPPPQCCVRPPQWCSRPPQSLKDARIWNGLELDHSTGLIIQSSPGGLDCTVSDIHIPSRFRIGLDWEMHSTYRAGLCSTHESTATWFKLSAFSDGLPRLKLPSGTNYTTSTIVPRSTRTHYRQNRTTVYQRHSRSWQAASRASSSPLWRC